MKKIKFFAASACAVAILLTACTQDEVNQEQQEEANLLIDIESIVFDDTTAYPMPEDVKRAITKIGAKHSDFDYKKIFNKEYVAQYDVLVEKDEFIARANVEDSRQYSTPFIVDVATFTEIDLFAYTGGFNAGFGVAGLSDGSLASLYRSVENWNSANSNIFFRVTEGSTLSEFFGNQDLETIVAAGNIDSAGVADFPSSLGEPGVFALIAIQINEVADLIRQDALDHLITHEIGHSVGFRHSDWDTRVSCILSGLTDVEEVEAPANRIFGTFPSFIYQEDSVMNACFGNEIEGVPSRTDKSALRSLYGFNLNF